MQRRWRWFQRLCLLVGPLRCCREGVAVHICVFFYSRSYKLKCLQVDKLTLNFVSLFVVLFKYTVESIVVIHIVIVVI